MAFVVVGIVPATSLFFFRLSPHARLQSDLPHQDGLLRLKAFNAECLNSVNGSNARLPESANVLMLELDPTMLQTNSN